MPTIFRIEAELDRLWQNGWTGPFIATVSPETKARITGEFAAVRRYEHDISPNLESITSFDTRYGTVTLAVNPWDDLGDRIVLGALPGRTA